MKFMPLHLVSGHSFNKDPWNGKESLPEGLHKTPTLLTASLQVKLRPTYFKITWAFLLPTIPESNYLAWSISFPLSWIILEVFIHTVPSISENTTSGTAVWFLLKPKMRHQCKLLLSCITVKSLQDTWSYLSIALSIDKTSFRIFHLVEDTSRVIKLSQRTCSWEKWKRQKAKTHHLKEAD